MLYLLYQPVVPSAEFCSSELEELHDRRVGKQLSKLVTKYVSGTGRGAGSVVEKLDA